ncbi:MAG: PadR family transcriptional regulator [Phycisphaerales bacterium]|nr:PadR family transcriptional regulator [Phycisphaerales bacterium]
MTPTPELLRGTLDMMILTVLDRHGPEHGYGIMRRIHEASRGVLVVEEGSLYPALHRLEKRQCLTHEWRQSESNRRARYYSLTRKGRGRLRQQVDDWGVVAAAVNRVLALPTPRHLPGLPA